MSKSEKTFLFFCIFTITLMFGRQIDLSSLNLSTADEIFLIVCYGIALYSTLGVTAWTIFDLISDKIHKK